MQPWQWPDACMQAIRKRLGWQHGAYQRKPKEMHRATHERLLMEYADIEDSYLDKIKAIDELVKTIAKLLITQTYKNYLGSGHY